MTPAELAASRPSVAVPPPPPLVPAEPARTDYYKKAFPQAAAFYVKPFPAALIPKEDEGNDTYAEARDAGGNLIGYLRDFTGPVSPEDECACNPLKVTLAFGRDHTLRTLLAPTPLEKEDHEPLTHDEMQRLIDIAKDPPEPLRANRRVEAVIDGTSGATRNELTSYVVPLAALSTQRIVNLVAHTQRLLRGAPASRDQKRLAELRLGAADPLSRAHRLAAFLPTAESEESKRRVYRAMTGAYVEALLTGAKRDNTIDQRLLTPGLFADVDDAEVMRACQMLADAGAALALADQCLDGFKKKRRRAAAADVARLEGTVRFRQGDMQTSLQALLEAARSVSAQRDPALHMRVAQASVARGQYERACAVAKGLFRSHPRLEGVSATLRACGALGEEPATVMREIRQEARAALLAGWRHDNTPAPALPLDDANLQNVELSLAEPGKATVLVVFSTWCPHCQDEIPRIVEFVDKLENSRDLNGRVRVIGVRTAIERETIAFDDFLKEFQPNFPIFSDPTMSLAFSKLAKAIGIRTLLPTTVVLDEAGIARLFVQSGAHRDTVQELTWAVEAVLSKKDEGR